VRPKELNENNKLFLEDHSVKLDLTDKE